MPFLAPLGALLVAAAPAIGAATGLASLGVTGYELANQPGGGGAAQTQPSQAQAVSAETANRQLATTQAQQELPGLQYQTGGGVSPGYYADMASLLSGNSQYGSSPQIQQLVSSFLGNGIGGQSSAASPVSSLLPGLTAPSVNSGVSSATNSFLSPQTQQDQGVFATAAGSIF